MAVHDTTFIDLLTSGEYLPAVGLALIALVAFLRTSLALWIPWFTTKLGGYALGFGSAAVLYLGEGLRSGLGITLGLIANALSAGWAAGGGLEMIRDIIDWLRSKRARASGATSTALLVALLAVGGTGCRWLERTSGPLAAAVIDCMTPAARQAIGEFGPALSTVLRDATGSDGSVDWEPVRASALPLKSAASQCVIAAVVDAAMRPTEPAPGAPQAAPLRWDPVALREGWEALRADLGGASYRLPSGVL
ncbi:MAG: hypothetical protein ACTHU0_01455 [Kofleriaceae bacterium]